MLSRNDIQRLQYIQKMIFFKRALFRKSISQNLLMSLLNENFRLIDRTKDNFNFGNYKISQDKYQKITLDLQNFSDKDLEDNLDILINHYKAHGECPSDYEYIIEEFLLKKIVSYPQETIFEKASILLCFIVHKNKEIQVLKRENEFCKSFILTLISYIQESSISYLIKKWTLNMLSHLTSISFQISQFVFLNIFFNQLVGNFFIFNETNDEMLYECQKYISHILLNSIYASESKIIIRKSNFLDNFFVFLNALFQNHYIEKLPDLILCIRNIVAKNRSLCLKLAQYDTVAYLNELFCITEDKTVKINIILVFKELVLNSFALNDIDMLSVISLMENYPNDSEISIKISSLLASFLQKCPKSADVFCQLNIIPLTLNLMENGAFQAKIQSLNIIFSFLCNASPGNQIKLIQPKIINHLLELISDVQSPVMFLIMKMLQKIISLANTFGMAEEVKNSFYEAHNISIIEEIANQNDSISEIALLLLKELE